MTTTTAERRYFEGVLDHYIFSIDLERAPIYAESPDWREVLVAPIPEIEVEEPDASGSRRVFVEGKIIDGINPTDTADYWHKSRAYHLSRAGKAEAVVRWIEDNSESRARIKAAHDALAALTDAERAEALR